MPAVDKALIGRGRRRGDGQFPAQRLQGEDKRLDLVDLRRDQGFDPARVKRAGGLFGIVGDDLEAVN